MLGPPSPQEGGRRCLASTGGRESSRPFGLTDGSSGISGGVDREGEVLACRREPRAEGGSEAPASLTALGLHQEPLVSPFPAPLPLPPPRCSRKAQKMKLTQDNP